MNLAETSESKSVPYTPSAMERVRAMAVNYTDRTIARELGWPISSLRERCMRHGIVIAYDPDPKGISPVASAYIKRVNADVSPLMILAKAGICWDARTSELTSESYAVTLLATEADLFNKLLPSLCTEEFITLGLAGATMGRMREKLKPFGLIVDSLAARNGGCRLQIRGAKR